MVDVVMCMFVNPPTPYLSSLWPVGRLLEHGFFGNPCELGQESLTVVLRQRLCLEVTRVLKNDVPHSKQRVSVRAWRYVNVRGAKKPKYLAIFWTPSRRADAVPNGAAFQCCQPGGVQSCHGILRVRCTMATKGLLYDSDCYHENYGKAAFHDAEKSSYRSVPAQDNE